jgi:hypothetical protein
MLRLTPIIFFLISFLITDQVIANNSNGLATQWLTSKTQAALNLSTIALARGHLKRGIHFAGVALNEELDDSDRLIAYHNLCIGHLALGREDRSSYYCDRAFSLAQEDLVVTSIRGAHFIAKSSQVTDLSTKTLSYVLAKNVRNAGNKSHLLGQLR